MPTYQHPGANPAPDMPAQLSAADLAWLQRLPTDPAAISYEDARVLAGMVQTLPAGSADLRLVSSIWLPVKQVHDTAQANPTEGTTVNPEPATPTTPEELLAQLPDVLLIPSDLLTVEESDTVIRLYAKALGIAEPTPAQIDAERTAARTEPPSTPRPGDQGRAMAARRFGPTATGPPAGDRGRAMAARRFPVTTKPRAGQ